MGFGGRSIPVAGGRRRGVIGVRPSFGSRLPGIEGMRAIAASSILVYHVWLFSAPDGSRADVGPLDFVLQDFAFGVTLFFTLSGFLLYRPYVASLLRSSPLPSAAGYFRNRALRIVPAYLVILFLVSYAFRSARVRDSTGQLHNGDSLSLGQFLKSAFFVYDYFPSSVLIGIGPAWSLAVEVVFYFVLPLLALAAWLLARGRASRSARRWAALAPALVMLVLGLSGKASAVFLVPPVHPYAGWSADWHSVLERSFLCQADLFAFGMALAVLRIDWEDGLLRLPRHSRTLATALALAGYLVTAKATYLDEPLSYSPYNTLMALTCTLVLALVVLPPRDAARPPLLLRLLETRLLIAVGLISYSLFLWHEPLTLLVQERGLTVGGAAGFFVNLAVVAALAGLLSILTYRFVEAPALRLKSRTRAPAAPPVEAQAAASATASNSG
jgi:peptidoglycan/LPS O-acetylase OafA/YrhL